MEDKITLALALLLLISCTHAETTCNQCITGGGVFCTSSYRCNDNSCPSDDKIYYSYSCDTIDNCHRRTGCGDCLADFSCVYCASNEVCTANVYSSSGCDEEWISMDSECPPPAYIPYLIVGGSFGYLLFMACCIKACTTRDEVVENETGKCVNCQHEIHHAYAPCKVQMPNFHQSCSCYVNCKASVTDLRIRHCGTGCGKTWITTSTDSKGHRHTHHHTCPCVQCNCQSCSPQIDCGCRDCYCRECTDYKYQSKLDRRFLYARYPFLVIGFFMIIFSSIFGWTFGIIWGVCCFFILFGVKRCDGHCGTPSREHRVPTTDNLWKYWDAAEEIAVMSRQQPVLVQMQPGMQPVMMMPMPGQMMRQQPMMMQQQQPMYAQPMYAQQQQPMMMPMQETPGSSDAPPSYEELAPQVQKR